MTTRKESPRYRRGATALAAAIDLAEAVTPAALAPAVVAPARRWKQMALRPAPGHDTMASLAVLEEAFFTYWNEASGDHVEAFWRAIADHRLPFARTDLVATVLARGGIRTGIERDAVVEAIADRRDRAALADADESALRQALADFDDRARRRSGPRGE